MSARVGLDQFHVAFPFTGLQYVEIATPGAQTERSCRHCLRQKSLLERSRIPNRHRSFTETAFDYPESLSHCW